MINTNLHQQAEKRKLANTSFLKNIHIRMFNLRIFIQILGDMIK